MNNKFNLPNGGRVENLDLDYETFGTSQQEMEYISPASVERTSIEKIKSLDLRPRLQSRGRKSAALLNK